MAAIKLEGISVTLDDNFVDNSGGNHKDHIKLTTAAMPTKSCELYDNACINDAIVPFIMMWQRQWQSCGNEECG